MLCIIFSCKMFLVLSKVKSKRRRPYHDLQLDVISHHCILSWSSSSQSLWIVLIVWPPSILTVGSYVPWTYYGFYCHPTSQVELNFPRFSLKFSLLFATPHQNPHHSHNHYNQHPFVAGCVHGGDHLVERLDNHTHPRRQVQILKSLLVGSLYKPTRINHNYGLSTWVTRPEHLKGAKDDLKKRHEEPPAQGAEGP